MKDLGRIDLMYDLDRGVFLRVDTNEDSKYDGLEGQGETLLEALQQLEENVEAAG